jgi:hypothetical protein
MNTNSPEFVICAMDAIEEGFKAADIVEECSCRMGFSSSQTYLNQTNQGV